MRALSLVLSSLVLTIGAYACSSDEADPPTDEAKGGGSQTTETHRAGGAANSTNARGGAATVGGSSGVFGTGNTSGRDPGVTVTGGAGPSVSAGAGGLLVTQAAGRSGNSGGSGGVFNAGGSNKGGTASGNTAGRSANAGVAGVVVGSTVAGAAAGRSGGIGGVGGAVPANAGNSGVSAAGAPSGNCPVLCGGNSCSTPPQCLEAAYGLGSSMPFCIPSSNLSAATICSNTACDDGSTGCQMTVHFAGTIWTLAPAATAGNTAVSVSSSVTKIDGEIGVPALSCKLNLNVPTAGSPFTATGATSSSTDVPGARDLAFDALDATFTGLTFTSATANCATLANAALSAALPSLRDALLEALNTKADPLHCSACRAGCAEQLACVSN